MRCVQKRLRHCHDSVELLQVCVLASAVQGAVTYFCFAPDCPTNNRCLCLQNWLFAHRKSPYPTKHDKIRLSLQTNLTLVCGTYSTHISSKASACYLIP